MQNVPVGWLDMTKHNIEGIHKYKPLISLKNSIPNLVHNVTGKD